MRIERTLPAMALVVLASCTGSASDAEPVDRLPDAALEPMAGIDDTSDSALAPMAGIDDTAVPAPAPETTTRPDQRSSIGPIALIGDRGHLGPVRGGRVLDTWLKWTALPSPDGSVAVMTITPEYGRTIASTPISWAELPSGEETHEIVLEGVALEANAVSERGDFVALTNFADEPVGDQIAGAKESTKLIVARRKGVVYETVLDGNFVAEAFGRRMGINGLPAQVFLLEYVPADDPSFYRVRVLSTATGEVSLPLDLRNKQEQVDERMAGFSRSQVIADDHGLLFTLYRGTVDGTPDGDPYAFVHTLDFADGVWCLDVDPALELDRVPGSLAVGGDRLYVASANGWIGAFDVPSISDPDRSPSMRWVVEVGRPGDGPPVMLADGTGVWVGTPDDVSRLIRLDPNGNRLDPIGLPSGHPTALAYSRDGEIVAVGDGWTTFGDVDVPSWFGEPVAILTG